MGGRDEAGVSARSGDPGSAPWLGVNFWSRGGGPRMWTRYDPALVRDELGVLAGHGLNVTRSFCFWPDWVPEPGRLDEDVAARFADFLDAHAELGLATIPTLVVGHMSGENWDPPWRQGRDLYRDVWLVAQQAWLAEELARRFARHPAVAGWLVSNEMPLYGGPASADEVAAWAGLVVQGLRAGGASQPVSLGDGAWGVEVTGRDNGYSLRALAPLVDFVGPHSYPMEDDPVRQLLTPAFACELAGSFGRPVVLEEFGVSSDFAADDHAAALYRQVLHTTLLAGARGWLAWCNTDFDDLLAEDPYRHHPFELHFGVTDRAGRPKPVLRELERFGRLVGALAEHGFERVAGDAAIVVPEHFERVLPFTEQAYRDDLRDNLLQGYVAAREADLPVGLVRERDGLPEGPRLLLLPSVKALTGPGLVRLGERAAAGATLYASYFAGSTENQRGPWLTRLRELFGVRHRLRYGLVDLIEDDEVVLELLEPLGDLPAGATLAFRAGGSPSARSYLPVEPDGADVVAVDAHGQPALLRHELGDGQAVLCTYPLEHLAARTPRVNPESTWRLYGALAEAAGVSRPVRVGDPRVLVGLVRGPATRTAVLVNASGDLVVAEPLLADGLELEGVPAAVTLPPYAAEAFRLREVVRGAPADRLVGTLERGDARD
jgi:endo-1,4-beta-mannosidase